MNSFDGWDVIRLDHNHGAEWKSRMTVSNFDPSIDEIMDDEDIINKDRPKRSFAVFKRGFCPCYEDTKNIGRLIIQCPPEFLRSTFENFRKSQLFYDRNISGIYINRNQKFAIWTTTRDSESINQIKKEIQKIAPADDKISWEEFNNDKHAITATYKNNQWAFDGWDLFKMDKSAKKWKDGITIYKANPTFEQVLETMRDQTYCKALFRQGRVPKWEDEINCGCLRRKFAKFKDIENFLIAFSETKLLNNTIINGIYMNNKLSISIWLGSDDKNEISNLSATVNELSGMGPKNWKWESFISGRILKEKNGYFSTGYLKDDNSIICENRTLHHLFSKSLSKESIILYRNNFPETDDGCYILETEFPDMDNDCMNKVYEIFEKLNTEGIPTYTEIIDGIIAKYNEEDSSATIRMAVYPYKLKVPVHNAEIAITIAAKLKQMILSKFPDLQSLLIKTYPHNNQDKDVLV